MERDNIDIFIGTIKDIDLYPKNKCYKIMKLGNFKSEKEYDIDVYDDSGTDLSDLNKGICEFTGMYKLYKSGYEFKDYIGFCQYRVMFDFWEYIPDLEEIFKDCDLITTKRVIFKNSVIEQYSSCHNLVDIEILDECIKEYDSSYYDYWNIFLEQKKMFFRNIFIMKKEMFIEYCKFIEGVMKLFLQKTSIKTYEDCIERVLSHKRLYLKREYPNNTVDYQSRFLAYLIERLTNLFYIKNIKKAVVLDTCETEEKYGTHVVGAKKREAN